MTGEKISFKAEKVKSIMAFELYMTTLGRCYEIQMKFSGVARPVASVEFLTKVPVYIYVNMPGQTTNEDSKSKVEVKLKQRLYIDVTLLSDDLHLHVLSGDVRGVQLDGPHQVQELRPGHRQLRQVQLPPAGAVLCRPRLLCPLPRLLCLGLYEPVGDSDGQLIETFHSY